MRIEKIKKILHKNRCRICAQVIWEKANRPDFEIYFETTPKFSDDFNLNPNVFLLAAILPAMAAGESRVLIDSWVCPELRDNLMVATGLVREWYGPPRKPIKIESTSEKPQPTTNKEPRAASFLSGGVDSLATLRFNQLDFPENHPRFIKDCLVLYGFDMGNNDLIGEYPAFERTFKHLESVAYGAKVNLIPIYTNARYLHNDDKLFVSEYCGSVLAAAAHAFSERLSTISISASESFDGVTVPNGTHPLLDHHFSSTDLQVIHTGFQYSRLDKVKVIADWPLALENIKVCVRHPDSQTNCGECHKCIRTMLELYVIDKLQFASSFPNRDITKKLVRKLRPGLLGDHIFPYYVELYPALKKLGRYDLIRILQRRRFQYYLIYPLLNRLGLRQRVQNSKSPLLSVLKRIFFKLT